MTTTARLSPDVDRQAWLEARRKGIGASEISAVLGISPWESAFGLYHRKVEGWEVEENEWMRWGTVLEPSIADWFRGEHKDADLAAGGLFSHPARPWQLATPDRLVRPACDCPDEACVPEHEGESWLVCTICDGWGVGPTSAVLECKWTGTWDGWGEPGSDDVPVYYRAQVLWQCDVVGVDEWYIAVLGPSGFREYCGRRDNKDIAVMVEEGRRFMDRLERGDPPPLDGHEATLAVLKRLHPDVEDETVEVDQAVAAGYARACAMARKAEVVKDRYEALLRAQMGRARRADCCGRFVASRSVYERAGYTVGPTTVDRLNPARSRKS